MPPRSRPLSSIEQAVHKACLEAPNNTLTQEEVQAIIPDANSRLEAINFLLATGLFKPMQGADKKVIFKASQKEEMKLKKEMGGEENMVLSQIQGAGNEGIWTKHLKSKTELHQTVITRCLKSLESKQLIKAVKSVKHPTRKIYMMANLEPSVEITGGPWYTDNELDVEFIRMLSSACLQYIRDRTLPKGSLGAAPSERKLFPHSKPPTYPNAAQVLSFLQKSRITDTELGLEHVEMLLNVLVYDGLIERLPVGGGFSILGNLGREDGSSDEEGSKRRSKKKLSRSDEESSSDDDELHLKKKRKRDASPGSDNDSDDGRKKKKRIKGPGRDSGEKDEDSPSERNKDLRLKRKHRGSSPIGSDAESSELDRPRKKKSKSKKYLKKDLEPEVFTLAELTEGSPMVYRALFETQTTIGLGWSETPCANCPQFEFCDGGTGLSTRQSMDLEEGPVNPRNCVYFGTWASQSATVS